MIVEILDAIVGTIWPSGSNKRSARFWIAFWLIFGAGVVALIYNA
jgi:hypothetical protein